MKSAEKIKNELSDLRKQVRELLRTIKPNISRQTVLTKYADDVPKTTYSQNWPVYEQACAQEKLAVYEIVCKAINNLEINEHYKGTGRPPAFLKDIVKALCIQAYNEKSSWRIHSELIIAQHMGLIEQVYKRSTLLKYLQEPQIACVLNQAYKLIAEPLSTIETVFAADATGMGHSYGAQKWSQIRRTPEEHAKRRSYSKLHILTGCTTNIIVSAIITNGHTHESPFLPQLLGEAADHFTLKEVLADAGYLSRLNVKTISKLGGLAYIQPKKGVHIEKYGIATPWIAMLRLFKNNQSFFYQHYHQRSNVEATFSALKRKYGDYCRTKKENSQTTELLARITVWNATVLAEALLAHKLHCPFMDN